MKHNWIASIDNYIDYFTDDHQLIISLIGIDDYFKLYDYFGKTGIYFSNANTNEDQNAIIILVGKEKYNKLFESFGKAGIYFSSASINALKKEWARKNRHIDYNQAARTLDVSTMTIYRWRNEYQNKN